MKDSASDKPPPQEDLPTVSTAASGAEKEPQRANVEAPQPLPTSPQEHRVTENERTLSVTYRNRSHTDTAGPTVVMPSLFKRLMKFVKELLDFVRALRR